MLHESKDRKHLLLVLISFNSLFYVAGATFGPYINVYYRNHGLSIMQIGILTTCGTMIALVMQPVWGVLADRRRKRVQILRLAVACTALAVLSYYLAGNFWGFLLCASIYTAFNCAIGPLGDTIVIESACKNGFPYSRIRMGGTVSYTVVVVFAGIYLKKHPSASFGLTACVLLAMFLVTCLMKDVYGVADRRRENDIHISVVLKRKGILFVLFFCCVFQIVLGCYNTFLSIFVTDLGYGNNMIGILSCISAASEIPVLLVIDRFLRKYKTEYLMLLAGFMMVVRIMLPVVGGSIVSVMAAQTLQGMTYMIMYYCTVMYMNNHLSQEMHGIGQALLYVMQTGIASFFSNALGGYLGERMGIIGIYELYGKVFLVIVTGCSVFVFLYHRIRVSKAR